MHIGPRQVGIPFLPKRDDWPTELSDNGTKSITHALIPLFLSLFLFFLFVVLSQTDHGPFMVVAASRFIGKPNMDMIRKPPIKLRTKRINGNSPSLCLSHFALLTWLFTKPSFKILFSVCYFRRLLRFIFFFFFVKGKIIRCRQKLFHNFSVRRIL